MAGRLNGKVAFVMGAGGVDDGWGNGKATAVLFAREGARVVAADIRAPAVEVTRAAIAAEGGCCTVTVCDATRADDVERAIEAALAAHGQIDILHNNVGGTVMGDPISLSEADWQRALDLNLTGAFLAAKYVLPHMLERRCGSIVNVSSLASIQVNAYPYFGYLTAKAGLNQLTRALAVHYAPHGIRANAILPGVMDTPLIYRELAGQFADPAEMIAKRNAASPMGKMGDAWDVAYASLYLASDESKYVTGVCLPVDGGKSCWGR